MFVLPLLCIYSRNTRQHMCTSTTVQRIVGKKSQSSILVIFDIRHFIHVTLGHSKSFSGILRHDQSLRVQPTPVNN